MVILIIGLAVLFAVFLKLHSGHKNPARSAVLNMILGASSLVIAAPLVGVSVNFYTTFTVLTLGVPGTALIAAGKFLL